MKLFLTSAGITNQLLADTLSGLVKNTNKKIAFIPTAANAEPGNKDWHISQFNNLLKSGYDWIDIVDPTSPDINWKERLKETDIIFISGGNTYYLLDQIRKTGFDEWIRENLEKKVLVGVSAGSIIFTPSIDIAEVDNGDENIPGIKDTAGLNIVPFELSPHTPEAVSKEANQNYASSINNPLIAYDDNSAVLFDENGYKIVSETYSELLNPSNN